MGDKANSLPRSFYVVSVVSFLFSLTRNVTQPIFTLYVLEMGASLLQVGFILSIQSFLMIVARIPLTVVTEKIGSYRMFAVAFVIQATASILYAVAYSPAWLYVIPFYQIIASGSFNQLAMATASDMAPATRQGDALGRYMTFMTMGMFVGPLITGALITQISYRQLYLFTTLFPVTGLVLFLRNMPKIPRRIQSVDVPGNGVQVGVFNALKTILSNRNVLVLSLIRVTYSMSNTVFTALFAVYAVRELSFSPSVASLLFSVVGFANALVKFPAGYLSDRIGAKRVLLITFGTLIMVYTLIPNARTLLLLLPLLVFFGLCWGTRAVTEWATLANTVPQDAKAIAMSYLSSVWGLGSTIGSIMLGVLGETLPFSTIFLILAFINVPALPGIYLMKDNAPARAGIEEEKPDNLIK